MNQDELRTDPTIASEHYPDQHDACGLVARFRKETLGGEGGTFGVLRRTLDSMTCLQQRGGSIQTDWGTDGDGAGVMTSIPPKLVEKDLEASGLNRSLASVTGLGVFFLDPDGPSDQIRRIEETLRDHGLDVLYHRSVPTQSDVLGPQARERQPEIIRIGLLFKDNHQAEGDLFDARVAVESELDGVHVVSLSRDSMVYKVMGTGKTLKRFYPELRNSSFKTPFAIGHIRMSTNTQPDFRLAHPYGLMVHNGEINTIDRLIRRARALDIPLPKQPSDTMVIDRILHYLISRTGCSLATAYRMLVPLVDREIDQLPERERRLHDRLKTPFGNLGQGPAAVIAQHNREALIASDAMALRPLWVGDTEKEQYVTSERGAIDFLKNSESPRPLAGGEMMLVDLENNRLRTHSEITDVFERDVKRLFEGDRGELSKSFHEFLLESPRPGTTNRPSRSENRALGLSKDDLQVIRHMADTGDEPLGSVGYHPGPIAPAADPEEKLLSDYCLEKVAVITNPSLDADREGRYFSLRVRVGDRGSLDRPQQAPCWELPSPLVSTDQTEQLLGEFKKHGTPVREIFIGRRPGESQREALRRIERESGEGDSFEILVAHDRRILEEDHGLLDPLLGIAAVVRGLNREDRRAQAQVVLESRRLRNLHDLMLAYGLGADLLCPTLIQDHAMDLSRAKDEDGNRINKENLSDTEQTALRHRRLRRCFSALEQGMKKVISTMGIHEIEGYGRIFSAIGLGNDVLNYLEIDGYLGSAEGGLSMARLEEIEEQRMAQLREQEGYPARSTKPWNAKIRNVINEIADGDRPYTDYEEKQEDYNQNEPTAIRHCLSLPEESDRDLDPDEVSLERDGLDAPLVFSAMSYGSQNLISHTAYAEAARRMNLLSLNGEGGEPPHLRERPFSNRGQQIASARFGIDTDLVANSQYIQIKVGQGAKPGEGGMLRGVKVNPHIARTRSTPPFTDLISPANNHDFYSIEDLIPTLINELRAINPEMKVDVKVPAIPQLASIVTGLAKEGHPDSISISGYEGSTGAARRHSIKRVGFPVELAVDEAHRALCEAGLRDRVRLQADGGMKTVEDVVKMGILGADRVGFGTLCMAAIGCIYCMQCYTNECPTGITSPFNTQQEAEVNDVKPFEPRVLETATRHLVTFFSGMTDHLRKRLAELGISRFEDLRGRTDLLESRIGRERLDLSPLFAPVKHFQPPEQNEEIVRDRRQTSISLDQAEMMAEEIDALEQSEEPSGKSLRFCTVLNNTDRAVGTGLAGELARRRRNGDGMGDLRSIIIEPEESCTPGNGLAAFNERGMEVRIQGGAQDGTAKSMSGGTVVVLPGENGMGRQLDGSVGKSAAYGATGGTLIVAGPWADSRFGVRCSGADLIHLGEVTEPLEDNKELINARANLKGFAFEYMTSGRGLVLGDPGMDYCSGMTGGVVYSRVEPSMGLTREALRERLSSGVSLEPLSTDEDRQDLEELLDEAHRALNRECPEKAGRLLELKDSYRSSFVKVVPAVERPDGIEFVADPTDVINEAYREFHDDVVSTSNSLKT